MPNSIFEHSLEGMTLPDPRPYYLTLAGRRAARRLARVIAPAVRTGPAHRLLAIGYPVALLAGLDPERFERLTMLLTTPSPHRWPGGRANLAAAADPGALPLKPLLYDQAVIIHALEHCADPLGALGELHRVLAPAGELILLVPNRLGRVLGRRSAFAQGQAYSDGELAALLKDAGFDVRSQRTALGPIAGTGRVRLALAVKAEPPAVAMVGRAEAVPAAALKPALIPA